MTLPSPEEYREFIGGLSLIRIRLLSADVDVERDDVRPSETRVGITDEATYEPGEGQFSVLHKYSISFVAEESESSVGSIHASFDLTFESDVPITETYFEVFKNVNLTMNTWPYLREFTQNMIARVGWPSFTLPLYKPKPLRAESEAES